MPCHRVITENNRIYNRQVVKIVITQVASYQKTPIFKYIIRKLSIEKY